MSGAAKPHAAPISVLDRASLSSLARGFLHYVHAGRMQPPFYSRSAVAELASHWDTDERDVLVCTAQKVGTHLTKRYLVEILVEVGAFDGAHPCATRDLGHGAVPWPEVAYSQHGRAAWDEHLARVAGGPRLWYTHCDVDDLPMRSVHPATRFVVCHRDPKAVVVSQYHFYRRHPLLGVDATLTLEEFAEIFLEGTLYFGDYWAHVRRWVERASARLEGRPMLVLRYEDLVEDKPASVRRIADFVAPGRALDDAAVTRIAERTGFDAMKDELTRNPQSFHFRPEVFFRAGKTDDWRNHLSPELAARIDAKTRAAWAGSELLAGAGAG